MMPPPPLPVRVLTAGNSVASVGGPRRGTGAALLVAAVLAAVVLGRLQNPDLVAGSAYAEPPAPPPTAGQCLLEPPPTSYSRTPGRLPPPMSIGDCTQPHFGEVVAVIDPGNRDTEDAPCWHGEVNALEYLGYPATPRGWWSPVVFYSMVDSGPDERQLAAGQAWIACAIAVPFENYAFVTVTTPLRNAHTSGTLPTAFAACFDGPDPTTWNFVPCNQPHPSQFFGQMEVTGPGLDLAELTAMCEKFILGETGISTLGQTDALQAHAFAYSADADTMTEATLPLQPGQTAYASCVLTAEQGRFLGDSLIALGAKPIPWAS